ncbi:MAG: HesA/MoeB/ThiF family protein [Leptospira sp.]|nr:HesA/MoeB/ThiF family protein [Leptospira sp.]NCS95555.1 HesA/MoeB/ThiF family protein [Leptospira sp.]
MERYKQQLILSEIGLIGQEKISSASVLVIGAGGLGSIVTGFLGAMGVGKIGICDFDTIEESNLHRQIFFSPNDIGCKKSEVLSNKIKIQNPSIEIISFAERMNASNSKLSSDFNIICDCSDNLETRFLINKTCEQLDKPLIHGALSEWNGYITVFHYKNKYSLLDLFEISDLLQNQSCSKNGINSTICGIIGSYMANEALKIILNINSVLDGKLLYVNGLTNTTKHLKFKKIEKIN